MKKTQTTYKTGKKVDRGIMKYKRTQLNTLSSFIVKTNRR